ncbi:putative toxin-antitoxin system toxin component, PIN family [Sulfobacillus thermotolerans]|uniref:Toxin-antitoxin system toxin component, PIN family n=1 Tax=Sulfobacillus thermotolerans TaxID=338644 RepID=A0ABM6RRP1_9FIRM|nr:putative toxin-antitoxin system toxin component, PIN family [Sulfobacillus thermotolerans]
MNAVIDTNVWVSGLIYRNGMPARVLDAYRDLRFTVVTSEPLLEELVEVLRRPKIVRKYGVTDEDVQALQALLRRHAVVVPIHHTVRVCRDPDDNVVIETAERGKAQFLVSGDAEEVKAYLRDQRIHVLNAKEFLDKIGILG